MNCPNCSHPASDHSNLAGCLLTTCGCSTKRRDIQVTADRAATAEALDRVERGSDATWVAAANSAVDDLAHAGKPFTTDDVWDLLADRRVAEPREPRALGPVMKDAARAGRIRLEGYATSRRRHGSLIRSYVGGKA